jgi:hypothetical protein
MRANAGTSAEHGMHRSAGQEGGSQSRRDSRAKSLWHSRRAIVDSRDPAVESETGASRRARRGISAVRRGAFSEMHRAFGRSRASDARPSRPFAALLLPGAAFPHADRCAASDASTSFKTLPSAVSEDSMKRNVASLSLPVAPRTRIA